MGIRMNQGELLQNIVQLAEARNEARQQAQKVTDQAATGETVGDSEADVPEQVELSKFENVLKYIDTALAPSEDSA